MGGGLELEEQLLADDAMNVIDVKNQLSAKEVEFGSIKLALKVSKTTLGATSRECGELCLELGLGLGAVGRRKRPIHDSTKLVCIRYTSLIRRLGASYRTRLNTLLADAQLQGEYLGDYRVCVWEDRHSLRHENADND